MNNIKYIYGTRKLLDMKFVGFFTSVAYINIVLCKLYIDGLLGHSINGQIGPNCHNGGGLNSV